MRAKRRMTLHLVASTAMVLTLAGSACSTDSTDDTGSANTADHSWPGSSSGPPGLTAADADEPAGLAYTDAPLGDTPFADTPFTDAARILPPTGPGGAPFAGCLIDYRSIDWDADAQVIVDTHAEMSMAPCTGEGWYRETAFQNGILTFMVLVGQEALAAAAPASDGVETMATSLRAQGFDRLATVEVAASGRCDEGEIQAALFTLLDWATVDGLDSMVQSATANGATVEKTPRFTTITGGGAPCATAIIHSDRTVGWVTAADRAGLEAVLSRLAYT